MGLDVLLVRSPSSAACGLHRGCRLVDRGAGLLGRLLCAVGGLSSRLLDGDVGLLGLFGEEASEARDLAVHPARLKAERLHKLQLQFGQRSIARIHQQGCYDHACMHEIEDEAVAAPEHAERTVGELRVVRVESQEPLAVGRERDGEDAGQLGPAEERQKTHRLHDETHKGHLLGRDVEPRVRRASR